MARPSRYSRRVRCTLIAVQSVLLVLGLGMSITVLHARSPQTGPASTPIPTIDPRLIILPHTASFHGTLAPNLPLAGTLYPCIAYRPNRLVITVPASIAQPAPFLSLVATMPDMRMVPVRARLVRHGQRYLGTINLPMFGVYDLHIVLGSASGDMLIPLLPKFTGTKRP
jgi:hypothetical protein